MQVKKSKFGRILFSMTVGALLVGSLQGMSKVYSFMKKATGASSVEVAARGGGGDTGGFRS